MADTGRSFELSYQCSSEPVQYRRRRRQSTASSSHPHNVALRPKAVHSKPLPARSDLHRASFFRSPMTTFLCTPAIFLAIELIDISLLPSLFYALAMLAWICVAATWTRMIWSWANFSRFLCIASLLLGRAYLHVSPRDVRIIGFYPAIMIHWLRLTFAVVGLEWIARRGFKWLDGFVAEKWPGVPLDPVKATASRAWRISTQPEVLKAVSIGGSFMVGSTLAYCIVNWQTYICLAQLQPRHPALTPYRQGCHPWHLFARNSSDPISSIAIADLTLGLPPPIFPAFGAPAPVLHRRLKQLGKCWHPDKARGHRGISHDESIRIWETYKQVVDNYPRLATVGDVEYNYTLMMEPVQNDNKQCRCDMGLASLLLQPHALAWLGLRSAAGLTAEAHKCPPCPMLTLRTAFSQTHFTYTDRLPPRWHPHWIYTLGKHANPLDRILYWFMVEYSMTTSFCGLTGDDVLEWIRRGWASLEDAQSCPSLRERQDWADVRRLQGDKEQYENKLRMWNRCMNRRDADCGEEPAEMGRI